MLFLSSEINYIINGYLILYRFKTYALRVNLRPKVDNV